jgi:hypothetical protein
VKTEAQILREKQLDAEQAWEYLQSKNVPNLDIERPGLSKVTLVELLAEFANGVFIGAINQPAPAEDLGVLIDRLDNLAHALKMPLADKMHIDIPRDSLPKLVKDFKAAYVDAFGENPWEGQPE